MKRTFIVLALFAASSSSAFFNSQNFLNELRSAKKAKALKSGGMDGGGTGGLREEEGAAWFYQDKIPSYIKTCVLRSPKFKASEDTVKEAIQNSFDTWRKYIQKADLYAPDENDDGSTTPYPEHMKILARIKFEECSDQTELTFYFGLADSRVKEVLAGLRNPKGFAFRKYEDIDAVKGSSKGIVWIFDPQDTEDFQDDIVFDWSKPELLQAILNHEIGHVMGVGHFDSTIMMEDLSNLFLLSQNKIDSSTDPFLAEMIKQAKKHLGKIDHESKLVEDFNFESKRLVGKMGLNGSETLRKSFKFFMKRNPVGDVEVELKQSQAPEAFDYVVADEKESKRFHMKRFSNEVINFSFGYPGNKLKRVRKVLDPVWGYEFEVKNVETISATVRGKMFVEGMKPFYATVEFNPGTTGYLKSGSSTTSVVSNSSFAIHFLDQNLNTGIMYVDDIKDWSVSDIGEDMIK